MLIFPQRRCQRKKPCFHLHKNNVKVFSDICNDFYVFSQDLPCLWWGAGQLRVFPKEGSDTVGADGIYKTSERAWLGKGVSMDNLSDFSGPCPSSRREWE